MLSIPEDYVAGVGLIHLILLIIAIVLAAKTPKIGAEGSPRVLEILMAIIMPEIYLVSRVFLKEVYPKDD